MPALLIALLLAAGDPPPPAAPPWPAEPTRPVFVTGGDWLRKPTPAQLKDAWPAAARKAGVGGKALLNCLLAYDGTLKDCGVISETPPGMGFGAAALSVARLYQLQPMVDGQSATDGRIIVPVKFQLPE